MTNGEMRDRANVELSWVGTEDAMVWLLAVDVLRLLDCNDRLASQLAAAREEVAALRGALEQLRIAFDTVRDNTVLRSCVGSIVARAALAKGGERD